MSLFRLAIGPLVVSVLVGCGRKPKAEVFAPPTATTVAVTVAPAATRSVQRAVQVSGTLYAYEEVPLVPKQDGRVRKVACDVGDRLAPGQLLGEFDPVDYELAAQQAERALGVELAKLGLESPPDKSFDVRTVPLVATAKAKLDNAQLQLERSRSLAARKANSIEELTERQANERMGAAEYDNQILVAKAGLAMVQMRLAELAQAKQHVRDTRVYAPMPTRAVPGVPLNETTYAVTARNVAEGAFVKMGAELGRLVLDQALRLKTPVPERHAPEIKVGQTAELAASAYPSFVQGTVTRINPSIDPTSRTFEVEILVPNIDLKLKAGGFATARILTRRDDAAVTVPLESIVHFAGVVKLFVVESGAVKEMRVQVGVQDQEWIEILHPALRPGALIVTSGQSALADGSPVQIRDEKPTEKVAASAPKTEGVK